MISYRDMTFCLFYKNCKKAKKCDRALTPEVLKAADKWWTSFNIKDQSAPISCFSDEPDCFTEELDNGSE